MAEKKDENVVPAILVSDLKQSQNVLNLETGEDSTIEVKQKKYEINPKYVGDIKVAVQELQKILGNDMKVVAEALATFATSQSYQAGKSAALSSGKFLTSDLKSRIVGFMRASIPQFSEMSAKDTFERWKAGYLAGKAGAKKILATVSESENFSDL